MSEELDVKIADSVEALWIKVRDSTEESIKNMKNELIISEGILDLAKEKLKYFEDNK